MKTKIVVGIDLGGTYVRVGLFTLGGELLHNLQQPIEAHQGGEPGIQRIINMVEGALNGQVYELLGIGMGSTGPVDSKLGLIQNPYTLPGWVNVPVIKPLSDHFQVPMVLENDADVAALGEYWVGAGRGVERLFAVTVGTGIGTALIYQGKIYRGLGGNHPEGGHHIIDPSGPACYCGANGCWESLAAGPAIARRAQEGIAHHPSSLLLKIAGEDASLIDAQMVAQAAAQGDLYAGRVMAETAKYIGLGIMNCIALFLPDTIVMGGGVMKSADQLLPQILELVNRHDVMHPVKRVKIVTASLGYHAGIYGAAYAIISSIEGR
jgi:glucokinase